MRSPWIAPALVLGALGLATSAPGQEPKKAAKSDETFADRAALNKYYEEQFLELDRHRIRDLTDLAARLQGPEAELAYHDIFNLAVARDLYEAADRAARDYLARGKATIPPTRALATFVDVIAAATRSRYAEALTELEKFLRTLPAPLSPPPGTSKAPGEAASRLDPTTLFAVGEAFLQRLIRDGRYDVARKVCRLFIDNVQDDSVKSHFQGRLGRIEMLGKPAPAIATKDVDGEEVNLADYKGKVVLIDFWASWAPICVAELPHYAALSRQYKDKGFQVLGVNVDTARQDVKADSGKFHNALRDFLVQMQIPFPVVISGQGDADFARAYGVTDIPANFLIDRDGKIVRIEMVGPELDRAVADLLGADKDAGQGKAEARSSRSGD